MATRMGNKVGKRTRLAYKKPKTGGLPSADELKDGMQAAQDVAAKQKARGFKKRKGRKGKAKATSGRRNA